MKWNVEKKLNKKEAKIEKVILNYVFKYWSIVFIWEDVITKICEDKHYGLLTN